MSLRKGCEKLREIMNSKNIEVLKVFKEGYCDKLDCLRIHPRGTRCLHKSYL